MTTLPESGFAPDEYVQRWLAKAGEHGSAHSGARNQVLGPHLHEGHHGHKHSKHSNHHHRGHQHGEQQERTRDKELSSLPGADNPAPTQQARAHPGPIDDGTRRSRKRPHSNAGAGSPMLSDPLGRFTNEAVMRTQPPTEPSLDDPSLSYARRPRHKTKSDKYEYKGYEEKEKKSRKKSNHVKRSSRRKSGVSLNQDFRAPNVESERVTLKQNPNPGIFSKAKASASISRRGLPDLTFSEMTFLNKKRDLDDARYRGAYDQNQSKKSRKATGQDVSEYFATPTDNLPDATNPSASSSRRSAAGSSPAKLLGRPIPSDVSAKRDFVRTRSLQSYPKPRNSYKWHPELAVPDPHHHQPTTMAVRSGSALHRSDSYISWSQSPGRRVLPSNDRGTNDRPGQEITDDARDATPTIHPGSSASRLARSPRPRHRGSRQQTDSARTYYTLGDLKRLAATISQEEQEEKVAQQEKEAGNRSLLFEQRHRSQCEIMSRGNDQDVAETQNVDQLSGSARVACEESSPFLNVAPLEKGPSGAAQHSHQDHDSAPDDVHYSESRLPLSLSGISLGGVGLLESSLRFSNRFVPPPNIPTHRLWQRDSQMSIANAPRSRGYELSKIDDSELAWNVDPHNARLHRSAPPGPPRFEMASSQAGETPDVDGLDAFDSALLRSAEMLHNHDHSNAVVAGRDSVDTYERSQLTTHAPDSTSKHYEREHKVPPIDNEQLLDIGSRIGASLMPAEASERRRPQLLKPSEEAAFCPEPFAGFSQPWTLH